MIITLARPANKTSQTTQCRSAWKNDYPIFINFENPISLDLYIPGLLYNRPLAYPPHIIRPSTVTPTASISESFPFDLLDQYCKICAWYPEHSERASFLSLTVQDAKRWDPSQSPLHQVRAAPKSDDDTVEIGDDNWWQRKIRRCWWWY